MGLTTGTTDIATATGIIGSPTECNDAFTYAFTLREYPQIDNLLSNTGGHIVQRHSTADTGTTSIATVTGTFTTGITAHNDNGKSFFSDSGEC